MTEAPVVSPTLVTERLVLRPLTASDASQLAPVLADPVVREMLGWQPAKQRTADYAERWIAFRLICQSTRNEQLTNHFVWAVVPKEDSNLVGVVEVDKISMVESSGELTLYLGAPHRGHGYGSEALREVIRWAFEDLIPSWAIASDGYDLGYRLGKLTALPLPENTASIAMLTKTQLRDSGRTVEARRPSDESTINVRLFSLTREEYEQQEASGNAQRTGHAP
jgi:RimJ/RimL family protein N-acetyltransferase